MLWTAIGWLASAVLVATIGNQVLRQWRTGHSDGVSRWLFVGQIAASAGFVAYSAHLGDPVFVVTNGVLLLAAIFGLATVLRQRSSTGPATPPSPATDRPTDRA
jgi:MtN3 and saliva related transmembrane protein